MNILDETVYNDKEDACHSGVNQWLLISSVLDGKKELWWAVTDGYVDTYFQQLSLTLLVWQNTHLLLAIIPKSVSCNNFNFLFLFYVDTFRA